MNTSERNQLIESYGNAYSVLTEALKAFPPEMWLWKPAPDKWSIHEILIHITDSEANSYVRCRRLAAEPGSGVYGYDQDKWTEKLHYHQQSTDDALELFRWLRKMSYDLLKHIDETTWQTSIVEHSEVGTVKFEEWLKTYEEHIPVHIRQMKQNFEAWKKSQTRP